MIHQAVLLTETIVELNLKPGNSVIDATVGAGGHAEKISRAIGPTGRLLILDLDEPSLQTSLTKLQSTPAQITARLGNFRQIHSLATAAGFQNVQAILLDLGFSSDQLESGKRGLSFQKTEPLLMTLTDRLTADTLTARDIINDWEEETLADIIYAYGDEKFSRQIARAIVQTRAKKSVETTTELVEIIRLAVPAWYTKKRLHFATRTFQALRLVVNDELGALKEALPAAWSLLVPGGRLAVITFHSLEAQIVKNFFNDHKRSGQGSYPAARSIKPTRIEILANPRARSAILRVMEKIN